MIIWESLWRLILYIAYRTTGLISGRFSNDQCLKLISLYYITIPSEIIDNAVKRKCLTVAVPTSAFWHARVLGLGIIRQNHKVVNQIWSTRGHGRKMIGDMSKYHHFRSTSGKTSDQKIFSEKLYSTERFVLEFNGMKTLLTRSCQESAQLLKNRSFLEF